MTREIKLALILGSALVLVVGVLISDHLSGARNARIAQVEPEFASPPAAANVITSAPEPRRNAFNLNMGPASASAAESVPVSPTGALVDPASPVSNADPVAQLLPPAPETAPQLNPSEQDAVLMGMAREQNVPITYEPPVQPVAEVAQASVTSASAARPSGKQEILVQDGDTLWSLAATHLGSGAQFTKILEANRDRVASDDDIRVGMRLRLPSTSTSTAKADSTPKAAPSTSAGSGKPASPVKASARTYTVKKGDTLGSIASSTLGSAKRWKDILDSNPGLKPSNLAIGAQLKLPPK